MIETWFPTSIYSSKLNPPRQIKSSMIKYVDNFLMKNQEYLKGNITGDVFNDYALHTKDEFSWLNWQIFQACNQYLESLGVDTSLTSIYAQKSWPVVCNKNSGFVASHCHKNAVLSAVYYLKCSSENGGGLTFDSPNTSFTDLPLKFEYNYLSYKDCTYIPIENGLMIFPSNLTHRVEEYNASDYRYSISYDLVVVSNYLDNDNENTIPDPSRWTKLS